jgi:hypothetical protein
VSDLLCTMCEEPIGAGVWLTIPGPRGEIGPAGYYGPCCEGLARSLIEHDARTKRAEDDTKEVPL